MLRTHFRRSTMTVAASKVNGYIENMSAPWMIDDEWLDWYRLTPAERWSESRKLWSFYLASGGSLDTEPDSQSPFNDFFAQRPRPSHGRAGLRTLRSR